MSKKKNAKKAAKITPAEPIKEIALSPEQVTQMFNESALKPEKDHELFPLFPSRFRWIGPLLSASVLGFAIFHGITKLPNLGSRLPEFQTFTMNLFILGFILRCASRPKNEDKIVNRIRVNSFAGASIFALATNCVPAELILGTKLEVAGIHVLMIQLLIAFILSYNIQKAGKGYEIKHPFKRRYFTKTYWRAKITYYKLKINGVKAQIGQYIKRVKDWVGKK